jgi:hypothetical protein
MPLVRLSVFAVVSTFALFATFAPARTALAADSDGNGRGVHTLTFTVDSSETERGTGDTGFTGLTKGDTYVSNGRLRNLAGELVGTYHVACTVTDEEDESGSAWTLCSTAAVIDGRGALLASAITRRPATASASRRRRPSSRWSAGRAPTPGPPAKSHRCATCRCASCSTASGSCPFCLGVSR